MSKCPGYKVSNKVTLQNNLILLTPSLQEKFARKLRRNNIPVQLGRCLITALQILGYFV